MTKKEKEKKNNEKRYTMLEINWFRGCSLLK